MDSALKYKIVEKIVQTEDEAFLNEIQSLLDLSDKDFWVEVPSEIKQLVQHAKDEINRGEGILHSEVMADIKSRFLDRKNA